MIDGDDDLIEDWLAGRAGTGQVSEMARRLTVDPALADRLVTLARDEAVLREWARTPAAITTARLPRRRPAVPRHRPAMPRHRLTPLLVGLGLAAGLVVAIGLFWSSASEPWARMRNGNLVADGHEVPVGQAVPVGRPLLAGAGGAELILGQAGGAVMLAAGTDLMVAVDTGGVELSLRSGRLDLDLGPFAFGRSLRVRCGEVAVEVVGTAFTVTRRKGETHVTVERGRVAVTGPALARRELGAGMGLTLSDADPRPQNAGPEQPRGAARPLSNGGFEEGLEPWMTYLPAAALDSNAAAAGAWGLRLDGHGRIDQEFATQPGTTYEVTAALRLDAINRVPTWGGLQLQAVDPAPDGWEMLGSAGLADAELVVDGAWRRLRFTFIARGAVSRLTYQNFSDGDLASSLDEVAMRTLP